MKHMFVLRFSLLILVIGFVTLNLGGGVASAASRPQQTTTPVKIASSAHSVSHAGIALANAAASPNIYRVTCGSRTDWFRIWTDFDQDIDCFANPGTISVALYNADQVCPGNNSGYVLWKFAAGDTALYRTDFSYNTCDWIAADTSTGLIYDVYVYSITIS